MTIFIILFKQIFFLLFQLIKRTENIDSQINRIPYMQKAVSHSLRNIQVTHRYVG